MAGPQKEVLEKLNNIKNKIKSLRNSVKLHKKIIVKQTFVFLAYDSPLKGKVN